jgi:glutaryl-CoA dehydrogenase
MMTQHIDLLEFLQLSAKLTDRQQQARKRARELVTQELMPRVEAAYEKEVFPRDVIPLLAGQGFLGLHQHGHDPSAFDPVEYGLIMQEIERCDSGFRSFLSVHSALATFAIARYGSEEQQRTWLPALAQGQAIGSFALTEPQGGSDPASMATAAEPTGDGWRLTGHKRWVTNGPIADLAIVWARTPDGVRGFLVPLATKGIDIQPIKNKLSLRVSASSEIFFRDVHLAPEAMLPKVKGLGAALNCLNQARYGIVWGVLGAAEFCLQTAVDYTCNRELFDKSLASFQLTQGKLADIYRDLALAQLYAYHLGSELQTDGKMKPEHVSLGKFNHVEVALRAARRCRELLGANGILLDHHVMRHMCNLETVYTYEGTHEIHQLILGKHITGKSAFV